LISKGSYFKVGDRVRVVGWAVGIKGAEGWNGPGVVERIDRRGTSVVYIVRFDRRERSMGAFAPMFVIADAAPLGVTYE
jgi:hypothetical protein